jgi:multidrug efflux pump
MVGGLMLSQALTLFTTPVIYIFFDNLAHRFGPKNSQPENPSAQPEAAPPEGPGQEGPA